MEVMIWGEGLRSLGRLSWPFVHLTLVGCILVTSARAARTMRRVLSVTVTESADLVSKENKHLSSGQNGIPKTRKSFWQYLSGTLEGQF